MAEEYSATLHEVSQHLTPTWKVTDWSQGAVAWRSFTLCSMSLPHQGWKIHVSCAAIEASAMCAVVAPVLLRAAVPFKIPRRLSDAVYINSGDTGSFQLGKIVTIYPRCDEHAAAIASEVDRVWPMSAGPEVQTDLHIRPGSAVSLRYGAFGSGPIVVSSSGVYELGLSFPDGGIIPDTRRLGGEKPRSAPDPPVPCFPPRAHPVTVGEVVRIEGRRYVMLRVLRDSPKARIFVGFRVETLDTVILKAGQPGVGGDDRGRDVAHRLRNEFSVLSELSAHTHMAPAAVGWRGGEWPVLIMEDFRGDLLSELDRAQQIESLPALGTALAKLHAAGYVHGDVKLANAVRRGSDVGLLDFELAAPEGTPIGSGGTIGYIGPEVTADSRAAYSRDIFALGACVAQAILGIPPGLLPRGIGRILCLLHLEGADVAARLVAWLSQPRPDLRPTAAEAAAAITQALDRLRESFPTLSYEPRPRQANWCKRASIEAALLTGRYCKSASKGRYWRNEHFMSSFPCEAINIGAAGIVLGLITVDRALGRNDFSQQIEAGAEWLSSRPAQGNSGGLFTGNAGVALALAVAGRRLHRYEFIQAARLRLEEAAHDDREVDLFSGSAGVVWASCLISEIIGDSWPLEMANIALGSLDRRFHDGRDVPLWLVDAERDALYLGCAHGSSGIAMALAYWGRCTGDHHRSEVALETFRRTFASGRTDDHSALKATLDAERSHAVANWCHGVGGYLWCLLQGVGDLSEVQEEVDWAVDAVLGAATVGTPTYCHGLAGQLELWRMLTGVPRHRDLAIAQASKAAEALRILHHKVDGRIAWVSDDPAVTTPDLWVGFLGPATALAMHTTLTCRPLLSSNWLRACVDEAA